MNRRCDYRTHLALALARVEARAGLGGVLHRAIATGEEPAAERVELVERDPVLAQAREELRLDLAVDGVVDPLVRRRLDPPVRLADLAHLRDFPPSHIIHRSLDDRCSSGRG